jgi:hypothetical protein
MEYRLKIGQKLSGLVVKQDDKYPQMWRIHYKDRVSDMVNLTRAKDAALSWVDPPDGIKGNGWMDRLNWMPV